MKDPYVDSRISEMESDLNSNDIETVRTSYDALCDLYMRLLMQNKSIPRRLERVMDGLGKRFLKLQSKRDSLNEEA